MFPVPNHLPKTGGDHLSSEDRPPPDPTLDLLQPLIDGLSPPGPAGGKGSIPVVRVSRASSQDVKGVRGRLEDAIQQNKTRAHELLRGNYPSVSSHIRLGDQVKQDFGRISTQLVQLEGEVDHSDPETSFLPPVLATLDRHFTAVHARATAQAHIQALRSVAEDVGKLQRLEEAVWAGRGADEWVMIELVSVRTPEAALGGTQLSREIDARYQLLRAMVIEQLSDSFKSAVALVASQDGTTKLTVHTKASLQQPKLNRPEGLGSPSRPSKPPPYSLAHIYSFLSRMESLDPLIQSLQTRLIRDIVAAAATKLLLSISKPDSLHELTLATAPLLPPSERIDAVSHILAFIAEHVFPLISDLESTRRNFLSQIIQSSMNIIIHDIILPAMPTSLASIPDWLEMVNHAVAIESQHASGTPLIIAPFFQSEAGRAWAGQRRKRVAEDVRKIIVGGWGGWEAVAEERDKDVVTLVEVEVSDDEGEDEVLAANGGNHDEEHRGKLSSEKASVAEDEDFGWGFEESQGSKDDSAKEPLAEAVEEEPVEEGWGFDETENATAGPSQTLKVNGNEGSDAKAGDGPSDEGDGWDFEMAAADPTPVPPPAPIAKPAREAKRLGKKVAKVRMEVEDDPWASEAESAQGSSTAAPTQKLASAALEPPAESPSRNDSAPKDDWSWGDAEGDPASTSNTKQRMKKKRKVLKEDKRTIKETFLISRACEKIVDVAERILREATDLRQKDLLSPSFESAYEALLDAATDVFDIYRSLLPVHFAAQVRDVPVLAMQLHNDARHLVRHVTKLEEQFPQWSTSEKEQGLAQRLTALADHAFESQLSVQKDSLMEGLEEARFDDVARDVGQKNAERVLNGVVHKLDTLSRVLRVVLPATTYLIVLGYLLDETVQKLSADILGLQDITEVESTRLSDLLKMIYPLEEIFILEPGQPSTVVAQVPHWLKFCYISELLNASLVDILYLFDSGALIDFTTDELVNLIRALFADSEKRDKAIERVERGPQLGAASEAP